MDEPPFDTRRADFPDGTGAGTGCARCGRPLEGEYYLAGPDPWCGPCGRSVSGDPFEHLPRALLALRTAAYGAGAAALTAYLLGATRSSGFGGILMVLGGAVVGLAVRFGSGHRGGWPYQLAAAGCAYLACTLSFLPLALAPDRYGDRVAAAVLACLSLPFTSTQALLILSMVGASCYLAARMNGRRAARLPGPFRLAPATDAAAGAPCADCGVEQPSGLLACPACARLVHGVRAGDLGGEGRRKEGEGDLGAAIAAWRGAMELLPPGSRQHATALEEVRRLSGRVEAAPAGAELKKGLLGIGALVVFVLTKGKFLLAGLTKLPTLLSMLATIGVYMSLFGWRFALGLVVSLYIHEMGHVWMMRRYGIRASAPMFIPGLGAFVRLHQYPVTPREDARVGLAGPIWGLGTALAAFVVWSLGGGPLWGAIAKFGAWINLFNLLPLWQLDGGRGFRSLPTGQRWIAAAVLAGAWWASGGDTLLLILALAGAGRAALGRAPRERDDGALIQYVILVAALTWIFGAVPLPESILTQDP